MFASKANMAFTTYAYPDRYHQNVEAKSHAYISTKKGYAATGATV